jgi:hypothetical protein
MCFCKIFFSNKFNLFRTTNLFLSGHSRLELLSWNNLDQLQIFALVKHSLIIINKFIIYLQTFVLHLFIYSTLDPGNTKGEVSLYCWPPVWLVWNWLYDYWQFLFLFAKQTNPNQSNRRSMVQWYFPF